MNRILLIDRHDLRRDTRHRVLTGAGYNVVTADDFQAVEGKIREAAFDLVIVSVADSDLGQEAVAYSERLRAANAKLPILALSDNGLFLPKESLISVLQSGHPLELIAEIAKILLESTHVRNNKNYGKSKGSSAG